MDKGEKIQKYQKAVMANESAAVYSVPQGLQLDITLEETAVISDITRAIRMIKGISSVKKISDNSISKKLSKDIADARKEFANGETIHVSTKEELLQYLNNL